MRHIAFLFLLFPFALSAQEDCQLFNIQGLASENLALHDSIAQFSVDTVILQPDGSFEVQLSNGTTFTQVQGCTDPAYTEYNAAANTDDGSCSTAVVEGCTDPAYTEYNATANTDNGSCSTAVVEGCTDPVDVNYNAAANTDDGSCASNACSSIEFDGYTYSLVEIGDQCWFAENLRSTEYANGSAIPNVTDDGAWIDLFYGARCDYDNDASNVATYGRLYNWYAVDDARGLCPSGWHVPTDEEWTDLADYITSQGFSETATALKSTTGWSGSGNGTDDFGFSALPGGFRLSGGFFASVGSTCYLWSSSSSGVSALYRTIYDNFPAITSNTVVPRNGFSVRCLRDAD